MGECQTQRREAREDTEEKEMEARLINGPRGAMLKNGGVRGWWWVCPFTSTVTSKLLPCSNDKLCLKLHSKANYQLHWAVSKGKNSDVEIVTKNNPLAKMDKCCKTFWNQCWKLRISRWNKHKLCRDTGAVTVYNQFAAKWN